MVEFLRQAAADPLVLAIKMTLFRVGRNSPIVAALLEASRSGKEVAVLLELKARFDEESNIEWAQALESEGVHVVYGLPGLKVHCKIALVLRRETGGIRRYVHMGTGNYNATTACLYTDIYCGSADMMPRNLNRRVETMFPIRNSAQIRRLKYEILDACLADTLRARVMDSQGKYSRILKGQSKQAVDSQAWLIRRQ